MKTPRTSLSHPLHISEIQINPNYGRIGISFCPGKQDAHASTGAWARDLEMDLEAISNWGATLVLTLVETDELEALKVPHLGQQVAQHHMQWVHLPIADFSIPTDEFEQQWLQQGRHIRALIRQGDSILVHCKGGLGRAGMIAARLLVELGMDAEQAILSVRAVRKGAIETSSQMSVVKRAQAITDD